MSRSITNDSSSRSVEDDATDEDIVVVDIRYLLGYLLTEESLSDISLQGKDGHIVPANKCVLAARSSTFRRILFGGRQIASSALAVTVTAFSGESYSADGSILRMNYNGDVLESLLEFIYTDHAELLTIALEDTQELDDRDLIPLVKSLVYLSDAALRFGLQTLYEKSQDAGCHLLTMSDGSRDHLSCSILEAYHMLEDSDSGLSSGSDTHILQQKALERIRANPLVVLKSPSLPCLSSSLLEEIVNDDDIEADELTLFTIIQKWLDCFIESPLMNPTEEQIEYRRTVARNLASSHIRLEHMNPNDLATVVSSSGLIDESRINEAYKVQAFEAASSLSKDERRVGKPRRVPASSSSPP